MSHALVLGPVVVPFALLPWLAAIATAFVVARRGAVRDVLLRATWIGLAAARIVFVATWAPAYGAHPWAALDVRDGGWDATAGVAAACLVMVVAADREHALRRPLALAFAAALAVWTPATVALLAAGARGPGFAAIADLRLRSLSGDERSLAAFAGRPVVLNLWATWCPPCRRELPLLAQAQAAHPDVAIVLVDQGEPPATVAAWLASRGPIPADVLVDTDRRVGARLDQSAYPTTLFFDAEGRLVDVRVGELGAGTLARGLARQRRISSP